MRNDWSSRDAPLEHLLRTAGRSISRVTERQPQTHNSTERKTDDTLQHSFSICLDHAQSSRSILGKAVSQHDRMRLWWFRESGFYNKYGQRAPVSTKTYPLEAGPGIPRCRGESSHAQGQPEQIPASASESDAKMIARSTAQKFTGTKFCLVKTQPKVGKILYL